MKRAIAALVGFRGALMCGRRAQLPAAGRLAAGGDRLAAMTLAYVLAGNARAEGKRAAGVPDTRSERWKLTYGTLTGTRDERSSGDDYRIDEVLGATHTAHGSIAKTLWHMNANGQVLTEAGIHRADDTDRAALRSPGRSGVTLLGEVDTPVKAFVVKVDPPDGRLAYYFFDRSTFLLDRVEAIVDGRRLSESFDDYRTTQGMTEPWHVQRSDGYATNDEDEVLQSL